ncbi:mitochondrial FAD-linked sulfhydryl oxidase-like protein ERV1 [Westerdykella ornata]|uniref:Sulfhydryl oxidase n=1 Tax=Westerdykella ornata TaxID=318751 RepID=A0A6A6JCI2_WESOR|nr:mitochondrial FAD-linked sulfhydryl oxidase-like protein ERV1 [Westerdykella ornata]KAF2273883.1 mitochondrial FAD-linked sulfhydryl oxidase-like protein ERV1 [Westerdykella ornata]
MATGTIETKADVPPEEKKPAKLPPGVVLGPDGKPCRSCSSGAAFKAWSSLMKGGVATTAPAAAQAVASTPSDCPPDVEELGRASWTLLHSITATYPEKPSPQLQSETKTFMGIFAKLYPCWYCAKDFQQWMQDERNAPRVSSRDEFGRWMCEAHNHVNVRLGKKEFDCTLWEERWRTGWKDGRCDRA